MDIKEFQISDDNDNLSLIKLTGVKIKDIEGWISHEFGDPVFQMSKIIFEDGNKIYCEGEHDMPYLCECDRYSNLSAEFLNQLSEEEEENEEDY